MNENSNTGMNKSTGTNPVNNSNSRGRTSGIERNLSRDTSMSSTCSSVPYHEKVTMNNGMDIDSDPPTEFPALFYEEEQEKELCLRKAAETTTNTRPSPFREIIEATFQMIEYEVKLWAMTMLTSSISNFPTIQMFPQNRIYRAETSTLFLSMDQLSKLPWTPRTSRTHSISWQDIFWIRR